MKCVFSINAYPVLMQQFKRDQSNLGSVDVAVLRSAQLNLIDGNREHTKMNEFLEFKIQIDEIYFEMQSIFFLGCVGGCIKIPLSYKNDVNYSHTVFIVLEIPSQN